MPAATGMPCSSLSASWTWSAAIIEAIVGAVGTLPAEDLLARQERAAIAQVQELIVALGHRALVAGRVGRDEDLDDPLDLLDARVDPGRADLPALPVDPEPGLAVVQAADDQVDVGEEPEARGR